MKSYTIVAIVIVFLGLANINSASSKEIYHDVKHNINDNVTTINLYEGENERDLVPFKKYIIKYSDQNFPLEKIVFVWNSQKMNWELSDKYQYLYGLEHNPEGFIYSQWNSKANNWESENQYSINFFNLDKELLTANGY